MPSIYIDGALMACINDLRKHIERNAGIPVSPNDAIRYMYNQWVVGKPNGDDLK